MSHSGSSPSSSLIRSRRNGGVHPRELGARVGGLHQGGHRVPPRERLARSHHPEHVRRPGLHVIERERAQVADVDHLQRVILGTGGEHPASRGRAPDPIREPVRRVVRANDVAGPDHQAPAGERTERLELARHLQRSVRLGRDLLRVGERWLVGRGLLVAAGRRVVGVDRQGRDERVDPDRIRQQPGGVAHHARDVAARVDRGVPRPAAQSVKPAVAVAVHVLQRGEPLGLRGTAMEDGHVVAAPDGILDQRPTDEVRPSDHQQLHALVPFNLTRSTRRRRRPPSGP